jgi:hypothetical protein
MAQWGTVERYLACEAVVSSGISLLTFLKFTYGLSASVRDFDRCPNLTVSAQFEARRDRARHGCWRHGMRSSAHHGLASEAALHGFGRAGPPINNEQERIPATEKLIPLVRL